MPVFAITYDVNSPNTELRDKLLGAVKALKGVRFSESTYVVAFAGDARSLWQHLSVYIDKNDTLLVLRLTVDCYGQADSEATEWFDKAKQLGWFA